MHLLQNLNSILRPCLDTSVLMSKTSRLFYSPSAREMSYNATALKGVQ